MSPFYSPDERRRARIDNRQDIFYATGTPSVSPIVRNDAQRRMAGETAERRTRSRGIAPRVTRLEIKTRAGRVTLVSCFRHVVNQTCTIIPRPGLMARARFRQCVDPRMDDC